MDLYLQLKFNENKQMDMTDSGKKDFECHSEDCPNQSVGNKENNPISDIYINYNSEKLPLQKLYSSPSIKFNVKIKIDQSTVYQIYEEFKSRFGYTISEIAKKIDLELESFKSALYRGNSIPEKAFKKLERLYGEKIPHTRMIGRNLEINLVKDGDSAELVGIMVCDGHLSEKIIEMNISLNGIDDPQYLDYVIRLLMDVFNISLEEIKIDTYDDNKLSLIRLNKQTYLNALLDLGLLAGDKVKNQIDIPSWIFDYILFIIRCLRGMIDTDGTIRINKTAACFRIHFRNASQPLVKSFKRMCNILGIKTGSILHSTVFDDRYNNYYDSYSVNISAKSSVKMFLDLIQPKKFEFRREYYGTWLLILKNPFVYKLIKAQIELRFPNESYRAFSKEFSEFLYLNALKFNLKLNSAEFERVINNALSYDKCIYSVRLGNFLTNLYKQLGSRSVIREFLEFYELLDPLPHPQTISKFIDKYLKEEKNINFDKWREEYKFQKVTVDSLNENIKYFPNNLRRFLVKKIYNIYNGKKLKNIDLLHSLLRENLEHPYLDFLLESEKYCFAFKNYLKELSTLVVVLIEMIIENRVKSDKFIHQNYELSFSYSTIANIKKEVKNLYYYINL